jgi:hypothetical protein
MLTERPLAQIAAPDAERFIQSLFAPDQRFARAFHHYWRVILKQNEPTATLNTRIELAQTADKLIENLADPAMFTVGHQRDIGYEPHGIFGYRALEAHPFGAKIARVVKTTTGPFAGQCRGQLGIAHCVGILDAHASMEVLKTIFLSIARKAMAAGHEQLFFFTSDHRLEGLYKRFGMEFPRELAVPDSKHLVGMFDLSRCENRIRVSQLEAALSSTQDELSRAA